MGASNAAEEHRAPISVPPAVPLRPAGETSTSVAPARPPGAWWAWHPLHGGSTATTLATALPGGILLDQLPADAGWPALPVVLICRSHHGGLLAAQQWAATHPPATVNVAGLVIVADAPGKLPRPLNTLALLIAGGYPQTWRIPWVRAWRLGEPPTPANTPNAAKTLLSDLAVLATNEGNPS